MSEGTATTAKQESPLIIPLAIVIAGALIAGAIIFSDGGNAAQRPAADARPINPPAAGAIADEEKRELLALKESDHVLGNRNAEILFVEYSDLECPFCKRFHETMKQVMDSYGKDGKVAWVYRHYPLPMHSKAPREAQASECAAALGGNDAFWKFIDRVFEVSPTNNGLDHALLPDIAAYAGLDRAAFNACLEGGKYAQRVNEDFMSGATLGVQGTPHTIIWNTKTGKMVPIGGALPFENVKTLLAAAQAG